jgi:serine/threonine-protein kinase RsbW
MSNEHAKQPAVHKILELRLPSKLGYERIAMDSAASMARRMGFEQSQIEALRTAIGEAVTNAIEHGNLHNETVKVVVALMAQPDGLIVSVADQGLQALKLEHTCTFPQIEEAIERSDHGGWGIWLIRELMDQVEFSTDPCGGNQVRMVIHLEQ